MDLAENCKTVEENIKISAKKAGREPREIKLMAVTKTVSAETVKQLYDLGYKCFGENRIQELKSKMELLPADCEWHMIGRIQKNKLKYIVGKTFLIHSLCSLDAAAELNRLLYQREQTADCLIEINVTGEESKDGIPPEALPYFRDALYGFEYINVKGLMTIGRYSPDPEDARACFAQLRELFYREKNNINERYCMEYLSMGMSGDYTVAIEEGANIVRIGTALFGERIY